MTQVGRSRSRAFVHCQMSSFLSGPNAEGYLSPHGGIKSWVVLACCLFGTNKQETKSCCSLTNQNCHRQLGALVKVLTCCVSVFNRREKCRNERRGFKVSKPTEASLFFWVIPAQLVGMLLACGFLAGKMMRQSVHLGKCMQASFSTGCQVGDQPSAFGQGWQNACHISVTYIGPVIKHPNLKTNFKKRSKWKVKSRTKITPLVASLAKENVLLEYGSK